MSFDPTHKNSPWLLPDCTSQNIPAGIYLIATPIGNLADITIRALHILSIADIVACEDTRVTRKLLATYGIKKELITYNDHSGQKEIASLIQRAEAGERVAVVSDAGMPLISDPGYELVKICAQSNVYITSIPGASAPLTALQLSGLPSNGFSFIGFLPSKSKARQDVLKHWSSHTLPLIVFESPNRVLKTLDDIQTIMPQRTLAIARELTKLHETISRGTAADLITKIEKKGVPKGEIVLIIGGANEQNSYTEEGIKKMLQHALKTNKTKDAVKSVAEQTGENKSDLYDIALTLKNE